MAQHAGGITRELMDEPHVAGHRVSVRRIHALVEERGVDPDAVADRLGLGIADIYRALAYYTGADRRWGATPLWGSRRR